MIRDPSDGTVRAKPVIEAETSGLATDKLKTDEIERLKASREWMKNWHHRKTESAGESNEPTQSTSET